MSFLVYLDESGITDPAACVVAGYAASSLSWTVYTRKWRKLLQKYRVTEFHAERFYARDRSGQMTGEYRGWSRATADLFLGDLINILTGINPVLVGTSVSVADFLALPEPKRRYLTGGNYYLQSGKVRGGAAKTPFHVAMQNTVIQAAKLAPKGENADFICDEQKQYRAYALQRFDIIKKNNPGVPLGTISYVSSERHLPLQAADLVCYAAFRFTKQRLSARVIEPSILLRQLITNRNRFDYLDKTCLIDFARGICDSR